MSRGQDRLAKLRQLQIVQLISKTPMRQVELASLLHVTTRTIFRDLVMLINAGYDVCRETMPQPHGSSYYEVYSIEATDSRVETTQTEAS